MSRTTGSGTKPSVELEARRVMRRPLHRFAVLIHRADRISYRCLEEYKFDPATGLQYHVASILLSRAMTDLRAALVLSRLGYILQEWSLVASLLEHCFTLGYVVQDFMRAGRWLDHSDLAKPPWRVRNALAGLLKELGIPEREKEYYHNYTRLSAAKHGNPWIQAKYSASEMNGMVRVQYDQHLHSGLVRIARYGLAWGLQACGLALWAYSKALPLSDNLGSRVVAFAQDVHGELARARELPDEPTTA